VSAATLVLAMLLTAVLVVGGASIGSIRCSLGADAVEVRVLGRVVRRVRLADIESVDRRGALLNESWSGPRFWNAVTLRRRRGLVRNVIVTPDDPDRFVADVTERLRSGGAPGSSL
jgi:hypothetical protein